MTVDLRIVDVDIAQLHNDMQLATQDLYATLVAVRNLENDLAHKHLRLFGLKLLSIQATTKILKHKINLAGEIITNPHLDASKG